VSVGGVVPFEAVCRAYHGISLTARVCGVLARLAADDAWKRLSADENHVNGVEVILDRLGAGEGSPVTGAAVVAGYHRTPW
jgi:hypothetical protein